MIKSRIGKCLYLVSSSATRDYVSGCVESLALPAGMVQHFRYIVRYIDDDLSKLLANRPNALHPLLRELPVVVVYAYQTQTGGHWRPDEEVDAAGPFIPLRCGRLIEAFREGKIAHFFFQVTDYVKPELRAGNSSRALLNSAVKFRLAPKKEPRSSYAHLGRDLGLADRRAQGTIAFQEFVDKVYRPSEWRTRSLGSAPLDITYDIVFARVVGIFKERGQQLIQLAPLLRGPHGNPFAEYELKNGTNYHIKINTYLFARVPTELPGRGKAILRLEFDSTLIRALGPTSIRLTSKYDTQYWSILADSSRQQRTMLNIVCDSDDHENDQDSVVRRELLCPNLSLPIAIVG